MIWMATILALTLSTPAPQPAVCFDSVVVGSVDRIDDIAPLSGLAPGLVSGAKGEWTIRVSRTERGEATPPMIVATGQAETLPEPRTVLRIFLKKDGLKHYVAVFWTPFATQRARLPAGLRGC
jgi:hypothetical protein